MNYTSGLIIISSLAGSFWLIYLFLIRGIRYFGPNTDNQFLVQAAAQSNRWRWLSDLHKFSVAKTGMMDLTVIGIAFFQKIFRDNNGDYPYMALGGFTTAVSAVLVYLVSANYWNSGVALVLSLLLLVSFWLWQVALYGGHANTAAVLFLSSVYIIQQINTGKLSPVIWLFLAGIIYGLTQFSSRSAIKYTPLFLGAVFYERHKTLLDSGAVNNLVLFIKSQYFPMLDIALPLLAILSFFVIKLIYKRVVTAMYFKESSAFLNKVIESQDKFPLEYYLNHAKNKIHYYFTWTVRSLIFLILINHFLGLRYLLPILLGTFSIFFIFTLPNIKNSFKYFLDVFFETQIRKKSHFRLYIDYFVKKGIAVSRYTQGGGWRWLPKIFFRMAPFHLTLFLVSISGLTILATTSDQISILNILLLSTMSVAPILWAQITGAPQLSRTFSPGLISMLIIVGYFLSKFSFDIKALILFVVIPVFIWNLWKFATDIYPARMTATNLGKKLVSLKIKKLYTYESEYNHNLLSVIDPLILKNIEVIYIKSLSEVKDGWAMIPGTSSKAMHMSSERESVRDGDYTKDPVLNELIETRRIEDVATIKFKALGSSNIWVHESEVSSFRDLMLNEVTKKDRFKGYAWLIHSSQLNKS